MQDMNCILDATFNTENSRKELTSKLALTPNQFSIIECICSEDVVVSRLKNRKDDYSDANIFIYRKMKKIYQPVMRRAYRCRYKQAVECKYDKDCKSIY